MLPSLPSLQKVIKALQQIPYLASKNIYRVALHILEMNEHKIEELCNAIRTAQKNCIQCTTCFGWKEVELGCYFCTTTSRNQTVICVVETWQELIAIESTNGYQGLYHVLGGSISPLQGISADDLTIDALICRVSNSPISEIILATSQTPEGEATAAYIDRKLKQSNAQVTISCLARGMPVGSSLDALDRVTIYKALSERRKF